MKKQFKFTVTIALCAVFISLVMGCSKSSPNKPPVVIPPVIPLLDFTISGSNYLGGSVSFKSNQGKTFEWDFGDSTVSTDSTPIHSYTKIGIYNVKLRINGKQEDTLAKIVAIGQDSLMMARIGNQTINWHHKHRDHYTYLDTTYFYNDTSMVVSLINAMTLKIGSDTLIYTGTDGIIVNFYFNPYAYSGYPGDGTYFSLTYTNSSSHYYFTNYRHVSAGYNYTETFDSH